MDRITRVLPVPVLRLLVNGSDLFEISPRWNRANTRSFLRSTLRPLTRWIRATPLALLLTARSLLRLYIFRVVATPSCAAAKRVSPTLRAGVICVTATAAIRQTITAGPVRGELRAR
jgi:hypothetical protein